MKTVIKGLDDFQAYIGLPLFTSYPIEITLEKIQQYCLSVNNQEWVHWDEQASKESGLEGIITPGLFLPSLYPQVFWDHVELQNVPRIIVKGIDKIRIYRLVPHIPISEIGGLISGPILVLGPNNFLGSSLEVVWP